LCQVVLEIRVATTVVNGGCAGERVHAQFEYRRLSSSRAKAPHSRPRTRGVHLIDCRGSSSFSCACALRRPQRVGL
jgi:hypothetical protein